MSTTITDFIRENLAIDRIHRRISKEYYEAMLELVKTHDELWPVITQEPPALQVINSVSDFNTVSYQLRQNMEWHTRDSYIKHFGQDPPTNTIVLSLARIWRSREGFQPEWA